MSDQYDFSETLADLDAGIFLSKVSEAVRHVAGGSVEFEREGKLVLEFRFKRIGDSRQLQVAHKLTSTTPTRRGKLVEDDETSTALYMNRDQSLSVLPDTQTHFKFDTTEDPEHDG